MQRARASTKEASNAGPARVDTSRLERSSRVGRFGPRSLGFRLLIVLLVPIVGLQVFAYREVTRQRQAATAAAQVRVHVDLLRYAGQAIVPLYLELDSTRSIAQAETAGITRDQLREQTSVPFDSFVTESRTTLDQALGDLVSTHGDEVLPDGRTITADVAAARKDLSTTRAVFDDGSPTVAQIDQGYASARRVLADIGTMTASDLAESATTHELAAIAAQSEQIISVLTYATDELGALAVAGLAGEPGMPIATTLEAAGAFTASLSQLRMVLDPAQQAGFDQIVGTADFREVESALEQYAATLGTSSSPGGSPSTAAAIDQQMVEIFTSSFLRLQSLQEYTDQFLQQEVTRAEAVQSAANDTRRDAIIVMVVSIVVSLVLLALVMRSILRPLRLLVQQSQQVSSGDLAVATEKPFGPTDIRVVMRAFNAMVTTLKAYESQVRRLAKGDTQIDTSLPGPLGDTLRSSVSHLAAVTSQLHASEAAAVMQARTDSLTGLANRTAALEKLAVIALQARTAGEQGAIIFLDLDGFKSVNDTQGHAEGDRILGEIGDRLRATCPDHVIARIGGDEFIVLVERAHSLQEITELAGELISVVSTPCVGSGGQVFTLSASAGVALVDGSREPLAAIAQADSAVYHAKEHGRGRVEVFDERLAEVIEERAEMALTMRQAIGAEQFVVKLQPIIDVATKQPIGAEALLRWNRPGIGEVGPTEFIPIAERTGVIIDLETWVLEQAVNVLRDWRLDATTSKMRLAVNISGRHIVDGNLASLLDELCTRASVDPGLLDLEITETHLVADIGTARSVVDDLREQGVRVAIDDFGTGYSSMTYLHQLTVDTLKIDRVFVAGMCDDRLDRTIVELLLRLGDSLGLKVIAEGVDSEAKLNLLHELHCPWAQGFYIAKPMGIPEATQWLRQQAALASSLL